MKKKGDMCSCCVTRKAQNARLVPRKLVEVGGALVCPACDCLTQWPSHRKAV